MSSDNSDLIFTIFFSGIKDLDNYKAVIETASSHFFFFY